MPVEIKELVIRAFVDTSVCDEEDASDSRLGNPAADEIVQECVRQVLRILESKKDR